MTGVIQGKDAILYFNTGSGFKIYGCATEINITIETEMKSVKTVGDGVWKKNSPQSLSYSISLNGLAKFDDNVGTWDLINDQVNFLDRAFRIVFISGAQVKRLEGQTTVQNSQLAAVPSDTLKSNFTLQGNGALNIYNDDGLCSSVISNATITIGIPGSLAFTANAGTAYISYILYKDGNQTNTGTVYPPLFSAVLFVQSPTFRYRVEATPYCSNDVAGTLFTKTF